MENRYQYYILNLSTREITGPYTFKESIRIWEIMKGMDKFPIILKEVITVTGDSL